MNQPITTGTRGAFAAAILAMLFVNACDIGGQDGGPGPSPGILGSLPPGPLPTPLSLANTRASTGFFQEPNGYSYNPSISEDGRFIAFQSYASNLVPNDTNGQSDVFVRDTQSGITTRVSVDSFGNQGNGFSAEPYISSTGEFVVFISGATNLAGVTDSNNQQDIFLHNRNTGTTQRVNIADDDVTQANQHSFRGTVSRDGNRVVFSSSATNLVAGDTNGQYDIFVRNISGATTTRLSIEALGADGLADGFNSNGASYYPGISDDGNFVVYQSYANDLVFGDTNGIADIFRTNVNTLATIRVSIADDDVTQPNSTSYVNYYSGGGNAISADGNSIIFSSPAGNLVAGDVNGGNWDCFVRNVSAATTTLVSRSLGGTQPNDFTFEGRISGNGNTVCFYTYSPLLPGDGIYGYYSDIYLKELGSELVFVSKHTNGDYGNGYSEVPALSLNGEVVAFASGANNLIDQDFNPDNDIFVHDRDSDNDDVLDVPGNVRTQRVSEQSAGGNPDADCTSAFIAPGGPIVVFESAATNLLPNDTNGVSDIFRRDIVSQVTQLISVNQVGDFGNGGSFNPVCSADGRFVAFESDADDLVSSDFNGQTDIFVRDTVARITFMVSVDSFGNPSNGASRNPSISHDGRYVTFESDSSNLWPTDNGFTRDIFLHDRVTGTTTRISREDASDPDLTADDDNPNADCEVARISGDGRFVVFHTPAGDLIPGDTNNTYDVFLYNRLTDTLTRVSTTPAGAEVPTSGGSGNPAISADGRFVVFLSFSPDLLPTDTNGAEGDIFVKTISNGALEIATCDSAEIQPATTPGTQFCRITADGRYVIFESQATTLVAGDTNGVTDVFIRDRVAGVTTRVSINGVTEGNGESTIPSITDDGKWATFQTTATTLFASDSSAVEDIVIRGPLN